MNKSKKFLVESESIFLKTIHSNKKARTMAGFFYCVVQNDIGLRGAGTLLAAGKAFDTAHHFTH